MASNRNYLTQDELMEYANVTITDTAEADNQISQAEELIDSLIGYQHKFIEFTLIGKATAGSKTTLTLQTDQQNVYGGDYFTYCMVEIIGGTGKGQTRRISASTKAGLITFDEVDVSIDNTSVYRIYQLGKFPRPLDYYLDSDCYYKNIPEAVKRAVAAQVEYIIEMGSNYFSTDKSSKLSEAIGDYSYTKAEGNNSINDLIAPKAKLLLRGYRNITGQFI